jgi:hypothetical protein
MKEIKPLYRKENKRSLRTSYYVKTGGEARWYRNSKQEKEDIENEVTRQKIPKKKLDMDFSPFYNYLVSNVGSNADEVFRNAVPRMPDVATTKQCWDYMFGKDSGEIHRMGENSYWSALYVDDEGLIQKIDPLAQPPREHYCYPGWTIGFNGKTLKINPLGTWNDEPTEPEVPKFPNKRNKKEQRNKRGE